MQAKKAVAAGTLIAPLCPERALAYIGACRLRFSLYGGIFEQGNCSADHLDSADRHCYYALSSAR